MRRRLFWGGGRLDSDDFGTGSYNRGSSAIMRRRYSLSEKVLPAGFSPDGFFLLGFEPASEAREASILDH